MGRTRVKPSEDELYEPGMSWGDVDTQSDWLEVMSKQDYKREKFMELYHSFPGTEEDKEEYFAKHHRSMYYKFVKKCKPPPRQEDIKKNKVYLLRDFTVSKKRAVQLEDNRNQKNVVKEEEILIQQL